MRHHVCFNHWEILTEFCCAQLCARLVLRVIRLFKYRQRWEVRYSPKIRVQIGSRCAFVRDRNCLRLSFCNLYGDGCCFVSQRQRASASSAEGYLVLLVLLWVMV